MQRDAGSAGPRPGLEPRPSGLGACYSAGLRRQLVACS